MSAGSVRRNGRSHDVRLVLPPDCRSHPRHDFEFLDYGAMIGCCWCRSVTHVDGLSLDGEPASERGRLWEESPAHRMACTMAYIRLERPSRTSLRAETSCGFHKSRSYASISVARAARASAV